MKKNVKCIAQTINLSQQKSCVRPRQVKKLVNADVANPCPEPARNSYQNTCRPVPIRVCTRRDMERTLPPKVCECPQKAPCETVAKKLYRWARNLVKTGSAVGLVYWTSAEGFWGDASEAEGLYHRIINTVSPALKEATEFEEMKLPHIENATHYFLDAYNRSVLGIVGFIIKVPTILEKKVHDVLFPCYDVTENNEAAVSIKGDKSSR